MKNKIFFSLVLFLFLPIFLQAAHIVGGEVTYAWRSRMGNNNVYRITMKIYRDRFPQGPNAAQSFDRPAFIGVYRGSSTMLDFSGNVLAIPQGIQVSPLSEVQVAIPDLPCLTVPPNIGVNEAIYEFDVTLPVSTESYTIVYQRCCRNTDIVNILNARSTGATYYVTITPEAQRLNNNSPTFRNFPPTVICLDEPLNFDHSGTDAEGDDLVYEFCVASIGGNTSNVTPNPPTPPPYTPVPYTLPTYSSSNPLGRNVLRIDPVTGRITGLPQVEGQFVVTICMKEYRNGVLLSTILRDFQFNVKACKPTVDARLKADSTSAVGITKQFFVKACGSRDVFIENLSSERANINEEYYWLFNIRGVETRFSAWSPTISFPDTGVFRGRLLLKPGSPCADTAEVIVDVIKKPTPKFGYRYDTCVAGAVSFRDSSLAGTGQIVEYRWQLDVGIDTLVRNPSIFYPTPGVKNVNLRVKNSRGCFSDTTQTITWYPVPALVVVRPDTAIGCTPREITFRNLSKPIDSTYLLLWKFGDGTTSNQISPTHRYTTPGIYSVSVEITSPIGCKTSRNFPQLIDIRQGAIADFDFSPDRPNVLNNVVSFRDKSKFAGAWNWYFMDTANVRKGYSQLQNPTFRYRDTGFVKARLVAVNTETGCRDTLDKIIDIEPIVLYYAPNAFTPNDDGTNDDFRGNGYFEGMKAFNMKIFSRWGELIFETDNPRVGWNGLKHNDGGPIPQGVYAFLVTYTTPRGKVENLRGYATLLR